MTTEEALKEMRNPESALNKARTQFRNWSGKIEQAQLQNPPATPTDVLVMEFEAVMDIINALDGWSPKDETPDQSPA